MHIFSVIYPFLLSCYCTFHFLLPTIFYFILSMLLLRIMKLESPQRASSSACSVHRWWPCHPSIAPTATTIILFVFNSKKTCPPIPSVREPPQQCKKGKNPSGPQIRGQNVTADQAAGGASPETRGKLFRVGPRCPSPPQCQVQGAARRVPSCLEVRNYPNKQIRKWDLQAFFMVFIYSISSYFYYFLWARGLIWKISK